ncbi:carboxypeptidase M32, partial [Clostridium sp.]|uniref:carboxypeptidase M32 n=1 Tax=Clostridium sp. TaxID=1506 RepID=UPI0034644B28
MREEASIKLEELKGHLKSTYYLGHSMALLGWDSRVAMPKNGNDERGEVLGYLSSEAYKLETSPKLKELIDFFEKEEGLDEITKAMIKQIRKSYDRMTKIPGEKNREWVISTSKSESAWEEAKDKGDFDLFKPHLKEMIDIAKEYSQYIREDGKKSSYEILLDTFEPGNTIEKLDKIFEDLKEGILEILNKIKNSNVNIDSSILNIPINKEDQESFVTHVLKDIGYDFKGGRMDESVHPFTIKVGSGDVRITTKYMENDFTNAFFSCVHEGGHAIYEQNIPKELKYTYLDDASSMGIHESQSRFYENIIARSESFWKYYFKEVKRRFPHF